MKRAGELKRRCAVLGAWRSMAEAVPQMAGCKSCSMPNKLRQSEERPHSTAGQCCTRRVS